jgi:hypothetical protein
MNVHALRSLRHAAGILAIAVVAAGSTIAGASAAGTLPDPCTLLTQVHAENTIAKGKTVTVKLGKLSKYGTGNGASLSCAEKVGTLNVSIDVSHYVGGFGGVKITSTTHPSGLGAGDALIVGSGAGSGGPVDFITFHTAKGYFDISANGANPIELTTLARQVYALVK